MSAYAIEKRGSDFIVKADQQDILKFATRRQAIQMIRDARTGHARTGHARTGHVRTHDARMRDAAAPVPNAH